MGLDLKIVLKKIRFGDLKTVVVAVAVMTEKYMSSTFLTLSSLPLPSFFLKKNGLALMDYASKISGICFDWSRMGKPREQIN